MASPPTPTTTTLPPPAITPPKTVDKDKIIGAMENEMEYKVELFNKLTSTCYNKCVEKRYREGELFIGETSCIDRCVSKYTQVTNIIGQLLASGQNRM